MNHRFLVVLLCVISAVLLVAWQVGILTDPEESNGSYEPLAETDAQYSPASPGQLHAGPTQEPGARNDPGSAQDFIDGRGPLDLERWGRLIEGAAHSCENVMRPDIETVAETLRGRYEAGEHEAAVFIAVLFNCNHFDSSPGYQYERQYYWAQEAARHDLLHGYQLLGMLAINRMMGYIKGLPEPGPMELERLEQAWHESAFRVYEHTGKAEDIWALASTYAHTYGPLFDEEKAEYWMRRWAGVASAQEVAGVGRSLVFRNEGGYANSALGSEFLLQAGRDGQPGAMINLMEFLANCEGSPPQAGLPSVRDVHDEFVAIYGNSTRAAMALATALSRAGNHDAAYAAVVEAQYLQQEATPGDMYAQQQLVNLAAQVRRGNTLPAFVDAGGPCNPQSQFPDDE